MTAKSARFARAAVPGGFAPLDSGLLVPVAYLPDVVRAQPGGGNVVIPGLAASIDIVPTSPAAADDEFDVTDTSPPMTGWTTLGSLAALDINSTAKSHLYMESTQTALRIDGIYKACPTLPFTVTAKLSEVLHGTNYQTAGIFVGEATPGKMLTCDFVYNGGVTTVERMSFTNPTTYGSLVVSTPVGSASAPNSIYLRLVVASSTVITPQFSFGGHIWRTLVGSYDPSFTVGSVGLFLNTEGGSATDARALFDWIRFT